MSGGSRGFISYTMEAELKDKMYDPEINDLMNDIITLAYNVERCDSGDIERQDYMKVVSDFKEKWFQRPRKDRLKKYIDESIAGTRKDLYQMIGVQDDG